jgi:hypothetical protein
MRSEQISDVTANPGATAAERSPVPEDSLVTAPSATRTPASPVLADSPSAGLAATRDALLAAYRELLRRIEAGAGDPRQADEVARLAEAAQRLVGGRFARRLVFGE